MGILGWLREPTNTAYLPFLLAIVSGIALLVSAYIQRQRVDSQIRRLQVLDHLILTSSRMKVADGRLRSMVQFEVQAEVNRRSRASRPLNFMLHAVVIALLSLLAYLLYFVPWVLAPGTEFWFLVVVHGFMWVYILSVVVFRLRSRRHGRISGDDQKLAREFLNYLGIAMRRPATNSTNSDITRERIHSRNNHLSPTRRTFRRNHSGVTNRRRFLARKARAIHEANRDRSGPGGKRTAA